MSTAEMAMEAVARIYDSNYFLEYKMIDWEHKAPANQVDMAIVKAYFTKLYRKRLQYSKASKGQMRFNESAMQSYEKQKSRDDEDAAALMFALMYVCFDLR